MAETQVRETAVPDGDAGGVPELSVVVTLFDERATLEELHRRLTTTLEAFGRPYEILYVDDGSTDGTFATLERIHEADACVRAVRLKRNVGQHPAMHAGLSRIRGGIVVTMDGDLQNPPEDVPRLVEAVEAGYDVASGRRAARHDSWGRTLPSRLINGMLRRFTGVDISDFGCAFNAYRREAVEPMLGAVGSLASLVLGVYGLVYWITNEDFPGPLLLGALVVAVLGVQGFILALVGEHLGRIQRVVEHRPLYLVDKEL